MQAGLPSAEAVHQWQLLLLLEEADRRKKKESDRKAALWKLRLSWPVLHNLNIR